MRCYLAVALFACAMPSMAQALSIVSLPPHKTDRACAIAGQFLRDIIGGKAGEFDLGVSIVTDELGKVDDEEIGALTRSLSSHDGKPDPRPAKVEELRLIAKDEHSPLYVAVVSRSRWEKNRYTDMDGMGEQKTLPPGYEERRSFWIVEFSSNSVETFREAGEAYQLAYRDEAPNVCG